MAGKDKGSKKKDSAEEKSWSRGWMAKWLDERL